MTKTKASKGAPLEAERIIGLPSGFEYLPAWRRRKSLVPPEPPAFDRDSAYVQLAKLKHLYVAFGVNVDIPVRVSREEAWFWLNAFANPDLRKQSYLEPCLPVPRDPDDHFWEVVRIGDAGFAAPCLLQPFITPTQMLDRWFTCLKNYAFSGAVSPLIGFAIHIAPYLSDDDRTLLAQPYLDVFPAAPNPGNISERAAILILAILGHSEFFEKFIPSLPSLTCMRTDEIALWLMAMPSEDDFFHEFERLQVMPSDWIDGLCLKACGGFRIIRSLARAKFQTSGERCRFLEMICETRSPEVASSIFPKLKESGCGKIVNSWIKKNFVHTVVGLATGLGNTLDIDVGIRRWFVQQWEQNGARLEAALGLLPVKDADAVRALKSTIETEQIAGSMATLPLELRRLLDNCKPSRLKLPAWIALGLIAKPSVEGNSLITTEVISVISEFQRVIHAEQSPLLKFLQSHASAASLESFAASLYAMWKDHASPLGDKWVLKVIAMYGSLASLHRISRDLLSAGDHPRRVAMLNGLAAATERGGVWIYSVIIDSSTPGLRSYAESVLEKLAEGAGVLLPVYLDQCFPAVAAGIDSELQQCLSAQLTYRFQDEMVNGFRRSASAFQSMVLKTKVLEIMQHLIWGVFDSDNNLEFAFRIDEDGVALGCEEERLELQEDHRIGVIHPMQFSVQERELWQNVLMDHQIIQPFAQIQRACCSATALELTDVKITRFSANETTGGLISQTFSDANWESTDGVGRFTKLFHSAGLIAAVRHDEFLALDWRDRQYHIQEVFFVDVRTPKKAWSKPSCRIKIGEVEPLILSEVLWLAHKACGLM